MSLILVVSKEDGDDNVKKNNIGETFLIDTFEGLMSQKITIIKVILFIKILMPLNLK